MKIKNSTRWSTSDLRAIISAACKARGVPSTGLTVEVVASKRHLSGRAKLGKMKMGVLPVEDRRPGESIIGKHMRYGRWMILRLPNPIGAPVGHVTDLDDTIKTKFRLRTHLADVAGRADLRERFARVVEHEVAHLQGLDHKHMGERLYDCTQDVLWLGDLPLREAEAPAAIDKVAAHADREAHARRMLAKAETRLKRAETIAKRWRRRVGYYERQKDGAS